MLGRCRNVSSVVEQAYPEKVGGSIPPRSLLRRKLIIVYVPEIGLGNCLRWIYEVDSASAKPSNYRRNFPRDREQQG